ncbi:hypothetical protein FRC04_003936 [Tulasnella sp. 424]|nr:hypothetical protein FRC04_003936 [Tulasnella sp. 424]KAG8964635.1 hypothetical protein FRC05_003748 [Tulasnella sp. 425]
MAFDTPRASRVVAPRKYTDAEKQAILQNFDLEGTPGLPTVDNSPADASPAPDPVESRRKKLQARLAENLADFEARHRHLISSIPRVLQNMTVEEFAVEYDGNIATFLEKATRAKMNEGLSVDIEASTRKRKQPTEAEGDDNGPSKASKTARRAPLSPTKPSLSSYNRPSTTPKASRLMPSTIGGRTTPVSKPVQPSALSRARFASASNPVVARANVPSPSKPTAAPHMRPPSTTDFAPNLPPKTPAYPRPRAVRQTDMLVSENGSPLTNPWAPPPGSIPEEDEESGKTGRSGRGTEMSLNSPPPPPRPKFSFVSLQTTRGATVRLDPNIDGNSDDPLAGLTDSAKKEIRDSVLKLAERYGGLKL